MHRFLLPPEALDSDLVLLNEKESHHARNVLRVKAGETVEVLDGHGGKFNAVVAGFKKGRVELSLDLRGVEAPNRFDISLAAAVIRPERMEWMLEKSCELGAAAWMPLVTERSVVKLSRERWAAKTQRWKRIAEESCKQCGLARVPRIDEPVAFKSFVPDIEKYDLSLIPTLCVPAQPLAEVLLKNKAARKILVLTGPEGDFSPQEVGLALKRGAQAVSLGPLVLRAETAALYVLSALGYFYRSYDSTVIKGK